MICLCFLWFGGWCCRLLLVFIGVVGCICGCVLRGVCFGCLMTVVCYCLRGVASCVLAFFFFFFFFFWVVARCCCLLFVVAADWCKLVFAVLLFLGCCLLLAVRCLSSVVCYLLFVGNTRRVLFVACCLLLFCVVGWLPVVVCCASCGLLGVLT